VTPEQAKASVAEADAELRGLKDKVTELARVPGTPVFLTMERG